MKIKYEFVDGNVELEVSDEWASVLAELDRLERNNDKKEKRRHYSLEACTYEGEDFMSDCDLLRDLLETEMSNELQNAIDKLQPQQKDLLFKV
ncbi:MAG: sigma-70 family RNA polymerase sigma factor, partial [Clostridia bacterium]|nr:sigma-70 family RNA polymerase sigma factor [Clostridia bacterium]